MLPPDSTELYCGGQVMGGGGRGVLCGRGRAKGRGAGKENEEKSPRGEFTALRKEAIL